MLLLICVLSVCGLLIRCLPDRDLSVCCLSDCGFWDLRVPVVAFRLVTYRFVAFRLATYRFAACGFDAYWWWYKGGLGRGGVLNTVAGLCHPFVAYRFVARRIVTYRFVTCRIVTYRFVACRIVTSGNFGDQS